MGETAPTLLPLINGTRTRSKPKIPCEILFGMSYHNLDLNRKGKEFSSTATTVDELSAALRPPAFDELLVRIGFPKDSNEWEDPTEDDDRDCDNDKDMDLADLCPTC